MTLIGIEFLPGKVVEVAQGNILDETSDAIVNPANSQLAHAGGLAAQIAKAGGPKIDEDSQTYIRKVGQLGIGKALLMPGHNLKSRFVIHAVGPVWQNSGMEPRLLFDAVFASMKAASDVGLKSISIPAISTGIFGFPKQDAPKIFFKALKEFFRQNPGTSLALVRFVNLDDVTSRLFLDEALTFQKSLEKSS